ncbi:MAG TPA: aminoglycoside phosphotransferase family protein [Chloroflexia bacterium]|nr:aminoglycoside phosphotransferase family protein [Chloroflexia bacterium]
MLAAIESWLRAGYPAAGQWQPGGSWTLALLPGGPAGGKLIALAWPRGGHAPSLVVKWPRDPSGNARLAAEHAALQQLRALGPSGLETPRPVARTVIHGRQVTAETALPGWSWSMHAAAHPARLLSSLRRLTPVAGWLTGLAARTARAATPAQSAAQVIAPLAVEHGSWPVGSRERAVLADLADRAAVLSTTRPLSLVFTHNDVGPANLLVDRRGSPTGLIDWEGGGLGLPAADLLYCLVRVAVVQAGHDGDPVAAFREVLLHGGRGAAVAGRWLALYCRRAAVDPAWLPVLLAVTWIGHVQNEARRGGPGTFRAQLAAYLTHPDGFVGAREGSL